MRLSPRAQCLSHFPAGHRKRSSKEAIFFSGFNPKLLSPLITKILYAYLSSSGNSLRGVLFLKGIIEERACDLAVYIIENKATVRAAAKKFGISKSTVHKDLSERLPAFNRTLYLQVKDVLDENKAERHIRGGIATREK
jgi:putative DeoR family transcriptional regulator (stage III sporulation protein D)